MIPAETAHRLPLLLGLARSHEGRTVAEIARTFKRVEDGREIEIPWSSLDYQLKACVRDGLVDGGPPYRLRAWSPGPDREPRFDLADSRKLVDLFRSHRADGTGERLWAEFTWSMFHRFLWMREVRWDRERLAHMAVRGIRAVMEAEKSLGTSTDFAASLLAGATAYADDRGKKSDEAVFRSWAPRFAGPPEDLATWLADPAHMRGQDPLALFLPNRRPDRREGFGWALTFGLMASPTLHAWSYSLDPLLPPMETETRATVTEGRHRPDVPQARVHTLLEMVLLTVIREDRGRYPGGVDAVLGQLDPAYRFQEETISGGIVARMHLAGKDIEGTFLFPRGPTRQAAI